MIQFQDNKILLICYVHSRWPKTFTSKWIKQNRIIKHYFNLWMIFHWRVFLVRVFKCCSKTSKKVALVWQSWVFVFFNGFSFLQSLSFQSMSQCSLFSVIVNGRIYNLKWSTISFAYIATSFEFEIQSFLNCCEVCHLSIAILFDLWTALTRSRLCPTQRNLLLVNSILHVSDIILC